MGFLNRHHDGGGTRYRMREKLFAIGEDFWIETEGGERAFKVEARRCDPRHVHPQGLRWRGPVQGPGES